MPSNSPHRARRKIALCATGTLRLAAMVKALALSLLPTHFHSPLSKGTIMPQLGKYSTDRDNVIHYLCMGGWANESFGDVESPTGYVYRISNTFGDVNPDNTEFSSMIDDQVTAYDIADNLEFRKSLVGHFLVTEDSNGFVSVLEFETERELLSVYSDLEQEFSDWDSQDD